MKKKTIIIIFIACIIVLLVTVICAAHFSRADLSPFLSTEIVSRVSVGDCGEIREAYNGYVYRFDEHQIIYRTSGWGTKKIAQLDDSYSRTHGDNVNYFGVMDENNFYVSRYDDIVIYNIKDKTEKVIAMKSESPFFLNMDGEVKYIGKKTGDDCYTIYSLTDEYDIGDEVYSFEGKLLENEVYSIDDNLLGQASVGKWYENSDGYNYYVFDDRKLYVFDEKTFLTTLSDIEWPEMRGWEKESDFRYEFAQNYIVKISSNFICVYDIKNDEFKTILEEGQYGQMSYLMTNEELCFSYWDTDIGNWPIKDEDNGTYKYTFETGKLEKISNDRFFSLFLLDERTLLGQKELGGWKRIRLAK